MLIVDGTAVSRARAAAMLGVSERNVYRYVARGLLRRARLGNEIGVLEEDVLNLSGARAEKNDRQEAEIAVNRDSMAIMMARLQALETRVAMVLRLLSINTMPLALTALEISAMYEQAQQQAEHGWSPHVEQQWADTFVRLRLDDLEQLERLTGDPHPWRVFHRLCATMLLVPFDKDLRQDLTLGKANLFALVGIWCQLKGIGPREMDSLFARDGRPRRSAVRRIGGHRADQASKDVVAPAPPSPFHVCGA